MKGLVLQRLSVLALASAIALPLGSHAEANGRYALDAAPNCPRGLGDLLDHGKVFICRRPNSRLHCVVRHEARYPLHKLFCDCAPDAEPHSLYGACHDFRSETRVSSVVVEQEWQEMMSRANRIKATELSAARVGARKHCASPC